MAQTGARSNMLSGADLLRRGATLLQEPCPKCGAVQIRYEGKTYCMNEDDLDAVLNPKKPEVKLQVEPSLKKESTVSLSSSGSESLQKLLEEKLANVSRQLDSTTDLDEQGKLLELISKYIETLGKLKKSDS